MFGKKKKNQNENKRYDMNMDDERTLFEDLLDFAKVFAITAVAFLLFVHVIASPVKVVGKSMNPTLKDGDFGFTSIIKTFTSSVQRYEVVVVKMPVTDDNGKETTELWVKRVIGMPGDTVEGKDNKIYVNGKAIDETYLDQDYVKEVTSELGYFNMDFSAVTVGEDEYFVMGDNRPYSKDSRYTEVGPIKKSQVFGMDVMVIFPFDEMGAH